jgi:uncharacterized protein (UPF0332 family)
VTPEAERSLEKADNCLTTARRELAIDLSSEAGRNAYLAAFHAARALIFERTGKVVKRHESVHREFHRLANEEPAIETSLPPFLSQGYNMKAIADYDTTPGSLVSSDDAAAAIETATRFVECIRRILGPEHRL